VSDQAAILQSDPWPRKSATLALRRPLIAALVGILVICTAVTGQSTARLGYPFLDSGPLRAPDTLYMPSYFPAGGQHLFMRFGPKGTGSDFELRFSLSSGEELIIWESTRGDATVGEVVGRYQEDSQITGAVKWRTGRVVDTGAALVYARIGQTLVVIRGPLPVEELLRIADSLHEGSPSSLML